MKIAILGAGAFGTALGGILANKGYDIDYYDAKIERERLSDVLDGAKYVVLAVPSAAVPYVLPRLPKEVPLIIATKGILKIEAFSGFSDIMVISGPGFADDIKAQKKTVLTATDLRVIELFGTEYLSFDFTEDARGVLMCGALKNVYAIFAGLLDLRPGTEEHTRFLREVAVEMKEVLAANGAEAATVDLVCGKGDLKITCYFPSRNYEFGQILRENPEATPEKTVEGVSALLKIRRGEIVVPEGARILKDLIERSKSWKI